MTRIIQRKTLLLVAAIWVMVMLVFTGTSYADGSEGMVKIGLRYGSEATQACTLTCDSGLMIANYTEGGLTEILPLPGYTRLEVTPEETGVAVRDEVGTLISADIGAQGVLVPLYYENGDILQIDGKPYRGGAAFYANHNGTMNVINCLFMDEYLYGVLNAEMGYGNPIEALKAQAVTARSFAVCNENAHRNEGFSLCASTHCQVYAGYAAEFDQTSRAVDETSGQVLTYDGKVVSGFYFKNSGGHTQSIVDAWGGKGDYLQGVTDNYSPEYPWSVSLRFSDIEERLAAAGQNVGALKSVEIKKRNSAGAVSLIEFVGTDGTASLKNETVRAVFGYSTIKSTMYTLNDTESSGSNEPSAFVIAGGNAMSFPKQRDTVFAIGKEGLLQECKANEVYVLASSLVIRPTAEASRGADRASLEIITEEPVVFTGLGYGHGVGMPQDSAIEMAKKGFTYEEILKYYYTGIQIK